MKSISICAALAALLLTGVAAPAQVSPAPPLINFQGRLANSFGNPVADGTYSLRFSLWSAASGGTEQWSQTLTTVQVKTGTFAVLLNTSTANLFDGDLYLEIQVGTDAPLTPRQQIVSVAYALKANTVPDSTITTAKIANDAVTSTKLNSDSTSLNRVSGGSLSILNNRLIYPNGAIQNTNATLSTLDLGLYSQVSGRSMRFVTNAAPFRWYADSGNGTTPMMTLTQTGELSTNILNVLGGSDVAEPYHVAKSKNTLPLPGMVVSIDVANVGRMKISTKPYDKTVAGIISGANGIKPGITLRQTGTIADGTLPVASIGRVWCWCDADANGAIQAGDMLTTSKTPGHAMKVTRFGAANGAVIGKAMSNLKRGKGLVLVLVSLK